MKAKLNIDQDADLSTITPALRGRIKWRPVDGPRGRKVPVAYYPKGTEFEGAMALGICATGQGSPSDAECSAELGWSPEQIDDQKLKYEMDAMGLTDADDRDLFRAGVIVGIDKNREYIHGPNWDAYNAAIVVKKENEEI